MKINNFNDPVLTKNGDTKTLEEFAGGGGGSSVEVTPVLTEGTEIADITVDGETKKLYAPAGNAQSVGVESDTLSAGESHTASHTGLATVTQNSTSSSSTEVKVNDKTMGILYGFKGSSTSFFVKAGDVIVNNTIAIVLTISY